MKFQNKSFQKNKPNKSSAGDITGSAINRFVSVTTEPINPLFTDDEVVLDTLRADEEFGEEMLIPT